MATLTIFAHLLLRMFESLRWVPQVSISSEDAEVFTYVPEMSEEAA